QELLAKVGLKESPSTLVGQLGVGKQQLVEIAKALAKEVKLLILDEPTDDLDIVTLNYAMLKSPTKTVLPSSSPVRELKFELTGNMNRYVWSLDNKVISETDKILVKKGEILRITLYNGSMMRHPMHLHGHDFRLINGQGDYAPLKNVVDIMPMETDTIEFLANEEGDWFFHCHILYHM
ncbi:multicopper oxidase domain-containing protein, partial [Sphaerisporangium rhizosphaerae]